VTAFSASDLLIVLRSGSGLIHKPPSPTAIGGIFLGYDVFQLPLGAVKRSLGNAFSLGGFLNLGLGNGAVGEEYELRSA
jgi:hypothetical protein